MTEISHGIWAAAVSSIAYVGHRVAVSWLGARERKNVRDEQRDERDKGVTSRCDTLESEVKAMRLEMKTFLANQRAR